MMVVKWCVSALNEVRTVIKSSRLIDALLEKESILYPHETECACGHTLRSSV